MFYTTLTRFLRMSFHLPFYFMYSYGIVSLPMEIRVGRFVPSCAEQRQQSAQLEEQHLTCITLK